MAIPNATQDRVLSSADLVKVNRNKKSIGVSFKDPKGADLIRKLALQADVFVENYLPGTLKKYGLDFKTLSEANPKLIYASVTGYGQTGPYSNRAGYDVMVEAYALHRFSTYLFLSLTIGIRANRTQRDGTHAHNRNPRRTTRESRLRSN